MTAPIPISSASVHAEGTTADDETPLTGTFDTPSATSSFHLAYSASRASRPAAGARTPVQPPPVDPALADALQNCSSSPSSSSFLHLGRISSRLSHHKLALLASARAYDLAGPSSTDQAEALDGLFEIGGKKTEWGTTWTGDEQPQLGLPDAELREELLRPWGEELMRSPLMRYHGQDVGLMQNLGWIVPFHLAASSRPSSAEIALLASPALGIQHIITLTAERALESGPFTANPKLRNTFIPVEDFHAPTAAQIQHFIRLVVESSERGEPVLVHCLGGKGRTGTMLAAYLVAFGFAVPPNPVSSWTGPVYGHEEALRLLRGVRPGSVETKRQEDVLRDYHHRIVRDAAPFPPRPASSAPS
ncbi:hypothetical protein JCM8097_006390 [Rhodosporidiobolus ruineniae]